MKIYNKAGKIIVDYPEAKSYGEALEKGVEDGVSFKGADLEGMDLRNLDLTSIRLDNAKCIGTDFSGSKFESYGKLPTLKDGDFTGANFTDAKLGAGKLIRSNFTGANFTRTRMVRTNLKGSDFTGATMDGVELEANELYHTVGNGKEIKSLWLNGCYVVFTHEVVQIDCTVNFLDQLEDISIGFIKQTYGEVEASWAIQNRDTILRMAKERMNER